MGRNFGKIPEIEVPPVFTTWKMCLLIDQHEKETEFVLQTLSHMEPQGISLRIMEKE